MESSGERVARKIIIAGASSSSGKTSITCGLLNALRKRGLKVCAYKTGCDYIDTEYLRRSAKCEAYNLDTWLVDKNLTRELFINTSNGKDIAIIEGVMGLYDGGLHSTSEIAKLLNAPVILVINAKSLGESAAAIALGFREYDKTGRRYTFGDTRPDRYSQLCQCRGDGYYLQKERACHDERNWNDRQSAQKNADVGGHSLCRADSNLLPDNRYSVQLFCCKYHNGRYVLLHLSFHDPADAHLCPNVAFAFGGYTVCGLSCSLQRQRSEQA